MSYSTNISKQNEDSNLVSSLMAAEQRPMDSNEERSRASPQNLELETLKFQTYFSDIIEMV